MWGLRKYLLWRLANKRQVVAEAKKHVITWDIKNKGRKLNEGGQLVYINHGWTGRVKLTVAKKFRCEYSQTQPTFAVLNTVIGWAMFRATFGLKEMVKVCIAWQNKGWTKVTTAENWEKVKGQVVEQPNSEENGGFSRRLVIEIEGQWAGWSCKIWSKNWYLRADWHSCSCCHRITILKYMFRLIFLLDKWLLIVGIYRASHYG